MKTGFRTPASGSIDPHREKAALVDWITSLLPLSVWLIFFWPIVAGTSQFGFRDTAHFYYPLYRWIAETAAAGESVQWNPLDDLGVAVAGDSSSAMYYPVQALLHCPIANFDYRFALYVSLHVLLAAYTARFAAQVAGCSSIAASAAGIGYAFGGAVLFQTCNVICLAGAAWLPCVFAGAWRISSAGQGPFPVLLIGMALALMVLGGDPQAALLSGLACIPVVLTLPGGRSLHRKLASLALAGAVALLLSGPQIAATASRLAESERSEGLDCFSPARIEASLREPEPGSHASAIYEFSFAPWRVIEAVWPSISGKFDFVHETCWSSGLPGADRIWTPSIYFGVVLLFAGACHCRRGFGTRIDTQLKWLAGFFLIASFGWYGPVWLINELQMMRGGGGIGDWPGKPTGGLYWLMVNFLPGFSMFRYPSRLLTIAMFAAALLGARGLDSLSAGSTPARDTGERKGLMTLAVVSGFGFAIAALIGWNGEWVERSIQVEWLASFGHTLVVVLTMLLLAQLFGHRPGNTRKLLLVLLLVIDLVVANWSLNGFIPRSKLPDWAIPATRASGMPPALYYNPAADEGLYSLPAGTTLTTLHRAEQSIPRTGWHRLVPARLIGAAASIERTSMVCWKEEMARMKGSEREIVLAASGIGISIDGVRWRASSGENQGDDPEIQVSTTVIDAMPRARLVSSWELLPIRPPRGRDEMAAATREVLRRQVAGGPDQIVIEAADFSAGRSAGAREFSGPVDVGTVRKIDAVNDRIDVFLDVTQRGLLILADSFDKNWRAIAVDAAGNETELAIFRANRVMSAVEVRPGILKVRFSFDPPGMGLLLAMCIATWGSVAGLLLLRRS